VSTMNTAGDLRRLLMETLEGVRSGEIDTTKAGSIAKLAGAINQSISVEVAAKIQLAEKFGGAHAGDMVLFAPPPPAEPVSALPAPEPSPEPPKGYSEIDGLRCGCPREWTAGDGVYWCCNEVPPAAEMTGDDLAKIYEPSEDPDRIKRDSEAITTISAANLTAEDRAAIEEAITKAAELPGNMLIVADAVAEVLDPAPIGTLVTGASNLETVIMPAKPPRAPSPPKVICAPVPAPSYREHPANKPAPVAAPIVMPERTGGRAFAGERGQKFWCDQCDRNVSAANAAICQSLYCKAMI
jgi:hypothetical protein